MAGTLCGLIPFDMKLNAVLNMNSENTNITEKRGVTINLGTT
jgi:hypothetical protein